MNNDHVTGFVAGAACTAFAFYWYQQNKERIDEFIRAQELGLETPLSALRTNHAAPAGVPVSSTPTLEELMSERERLDDMIAEMQAKPE